ncbi:phage tail assembly chaperone [Pseudobacteroides cellulosolvens]|uniref:XkdN-like protein n=1 Tax=Pseudobacteroides cellulosolvens ATCC 35603 = DSM 2933 TaxID=398512 RepID=A0A0L6JLQ6_9FIRM|nr:hypothetical protein [Pseudobacteroides cellulosolvens]KNY26322.1 XkdN-like protein [Pseudobacteroides cellulosolvens ATCC 35603 = DSM 2933]
MSKLQAFLNKNIIEEVTEEVIISNRFRDEDTGEILKFKIRPVPLSEYKTIQKACTKITKNGAEFDNVTFAEKIVIEGTVDPNFKDAESIKAVGATLPIQYLYKVLRSGEVISLSEKILILSGFGENLEELVEEAKN